MTAKQFRLALADLDLSQGKAAELLGLTRRTTVRYATGRTPIPGPVRILLNLLVGDAVTADQVDAVR